MNSRRKTRRKIRPEAAKALAVLLILALCLYVALATAAGTFIAEKIIAPIFRFAGNFSPKESDTVTEQPNGTFVPQVSAAKELSAADTPTNDAQGDGLLLSPDDEANSSNSQALSSGSMSEELSIEASKNYVLQLGVFTSKENADNAATNARVRGAAGYVYEDAGKYRVFAAAYTNEGDIKKVMDNLKKEQNVDSSMYIFETPGASLRITASNNGLKSAKEAFETLDSSRKDLYTLCSSLDKGETTEEKAREKLADMATKAAAPIETLSGAGAGEVGSKLLAELKNTSDALNDLAKSASTGRAFSALLKHALVRQIDANTSLMKAITGTAVVN